MKALPSQKEVSKLYNYDMPFHVSFCMHIVVKEPPYQVSESGYGSFNLPIEVYFRNKDEPKKVRFEYDLLLPNLNDPPINQIRSECLTFQNPSDEFKSKLLKAGGTMTGPGGNSIAPPQKIKRPAEEAELQQHKKATKAKKIKKSGGDSSGSDTSSDSESDDQPPQSSATKTTKSPSSSKKSPNSWDTAALKRLHKHLNSLQDPQRLQEIVNIIEQTGQYNLTQSTFDFDLCKLDDHTLNKLTKFMDGGNSIS